LACFHLNETHLNLAIEKDTVVDGGILCVPHLSHSVQSTKVLPFVAPMLCALDLALLLPFGLIPNSIVAHISKCHKKSKL
jgi:hypothetical protein